MADTERLATLLGYAWDTEAERPALGLPSMAERVAARLVAAGVTVGPARDDVAEYRAAAHRGSARVTVGPAPLDVERLARALAAADPDDDGNAPSSHDGSYGAYWLRKAAAIAREYERTES